MIDLSLTFHSIYTLQILLHCKNQEFQAVLMYIPFLHSTSRSVRILPQHGSSHSRVCRLACHSPLHRFPQPRHNHSQNSRSVSDASFDLLLEYIHCWILAMRKIKTNINIHILYSISFNKASLRIFCNFQGTPGDCFKLFRRQKQTLSLACLFSKSLHFIIKSQQMPKTPGRLFSAHCARCNLVRCSP